MVYIGLILIICIIISMFYYKKKWNPIKKPIFLNNKMITIGHRGTNVEAHENTYNAFNKALESGLSGVEFDVQITSDNKLIIYHDWTCNKILSKEKRIEKNTYTILKNISLNHASFDKIPLLSDILNMLPKKFIKIIEIKSKYIQNTGIEQKILTLINKNKITNYCIISSFNPFVLRRIKKMNKNIQTALLWTLDEPQFILNSPLWVWWCRPDGFHADINYLNTKLAKWIKNKNLSLIGYTIKNKQQLKKALLLNLDGIIIDDPNLITR